MKIPIPSNIYDPLDGQVLDCPLDVILLERFRGGDAIIRPTGYFIVLVQSVFELFLCKRNTGSRPGAFQGLEELLG